APVAGARCVRAVPALPHGGAYRSPRPSLEMIQPAAKAAPNAASGRSRISSAALSIMSRPLSMSTSACSRAARLACSAAVRPARALSDRSAFTCALPSRSSSPAAPAAPLRASPASRAARLRWSPASPRLPLRAAPGCPLEEVVEVASVGLIWESPGRGVTPSLHRQDSLPIAPDDVQDQLCGRLCEARAEARQIIETAGAGGHHHIALSQAIAGRTAAARDRLHQHPARTRLAQALGQFGEGVAAQPRVELVAGVAARLVADLGGHLQRLAMATHVQRDAAANRLQALEVVQVGRALDPLAIGGHDHVAWLQPRRRGG